MQQLLQGEPCPDQAVNGLMPHLLHQLHAIQQQYRYIPTQQSKQVSETLQLPLAQIESVIDFYSFFTRTPRGQYTLLFSNCTSCGDLALMRELCQLLKVEQGITRTDGLVSIDETSCIGMCDHGASLLINDRVIAHLDSTRLKQIAEYIESKTPLDQWSPELFSINTQIYKKGLLLEQPLEQGSALTAAFKLGSDALIQTLKQSGLRGRGGAGFTTGMKWEFCRQAQGAQHYVVCNADEGEPGTFKDRILLTDHAHELFEGMTVAAYALGAQQGYLYLRGEYRYLVPHIQQVLTERRQQQLLGQNILGQQGFTFDIELVVGAGAYICGEESALLESLEQKRGVPRIRPPFPVTHGYLGQPTVVNNVETFVAAAHIVSKGANWFKAHGTEQSAGSKLLSISGDCTKAGIYEYAFGVTVQQVLDDCGASDAQAVQVGGPSGTLVHRKDFGRQLAFEDLATGGSIMIYGQQRDLLKVVRNFTHFFAHESCGFCTPCRVGTPLLRKYLDKIEAGHGTAYDREEMARLAKLVKKRSHCGLGQTAANPILDLLEHFPHVCEQRLLHQEYEPFFNLDAALETTRQLSHRDDAEAHLA
ncbi:NADH-ubiquinone oxidoreductase-F iron-sulfur binding region domain-containing protein [Thiolinea disciformis]|uniref:NADH-ubiquinone oxidoreductase-F iron-sulfur binding region domain-containing protein n=1 Tax=Thiolinea disciformis TaxID=125614 RepID=UPI00036AD948|nr:NADH-ubiquinone oxidoreductase-F iron-sulfur binding region domain-containing protein [Thiolinea disciformis]